MPKKTTTPLRDNDVVGLMTDEADWKVPPQLKRAQELNKQVPRFVPPQKALVPIGGGFYATPDAPARLGDCDRWKGFPGCGRATLGKGLIGLGFDIVKSDNLVGIQLSPMLGGINLPEFQIAYGHKFTLPNVIEDPSKPISRKLGESGKVYGLGRNFDEDQLVFAALNTTATEFYFNTVSGCTPARQRTGVNVENYRWNQPDVTRDTEGNAVSVTATRKTERDKTVTPTRCEGTDGNVTTPFSYTTETTEQAFTQGIQSGNSITFHRDGYPYSYRIAGTTRLVNAGTSLRSPSFTVHGGEIDEIMILFGTTSHSGIVSGRWGDIKKMWGIPAGGFDADQKFGEIAWVVPVDASKPEKAYPPSLPPKRCCPMPCCPDSSNNEWLLREILKEAKKANKAIGSDDMGYSVPADITDDSAGTVKIESLAQAHSHGIKIKDQIAGQYPVKLKIKDSNLTEEGNQELELSFDNQAELMAELMGLLYQTKVTTEATLNVNARNLSETGATRNQSLQTWYLLLAMAEYIGFQMEQEKKSIPYAYNPEANSLDTLLQESKKEMATFKWKGGRDLQQWLSDLGYAATLLKASVFRPTGGLEETKATLKELLKEDDSEAGDNKLDFDDFVRQVEQGFSAVPGIDTMLMNKPYGRDFNRRPNIKELDVDADTNPEPTT